MATTRGSVSAPARRLSTGRRKTPTGVESTLRSLELSVLHPLLGGKYQLSETALSATVMIGTTGPIGVIMMMIDDLMGQSEEGCQFVIGWGAGLACTIGLVNVSSIFPGTRKSSKRWLMRGFPMSSYFAEMLTRIVWSQGRTDARQQGKSRFLHGVLKD